jgi:hypothetical protein
MPWWASGNCTWAEVSARPQNYLLNRHQLLQRGAKHYILCPLSPPLTRPLHPISIVNSIGPKSSSFACLFSVLLQYCGVCCLWINWKLSVKRSLVTMFYRVLATSQQFVWRGSQSIDKRLEWPHFAQKASLYTMGGMAQIVSKNLRLLL